MKAALAVAIVLGFLCLMFSIDFFAKEELGKQNVFLDELVYRRYFSSKIPPMFDLLCFGLMFLAFRYGVRKKNPLTKTGLFFIWGSVAAYVLVLVNPNSPLSEVNRLIESVPILLIPILFYVLLRMDEEYYIPLMRALLLSMVVVAALRAVVLIGFFAVGKGSYAYKNTNATLSEGDVLYFYALLQVIMLILFMIRRDRKSFVALALFFIVVLFSFRRTWVGLALFTTIGVLVINTLIYSTPMKKILMVTSIAVALYMGYFQEDALRQIFGVYAERYSVILHWFRETSEYSMGGDSGHYIEATMSMDIALARAGLFGVGVGAQFPTILALNKWTQQGFHNVYADVLLRHGYVFFGLFISMIVMTVVTTLKLLREARMVPRPYFLMKFAILLFLIVFYGVLFYNATWFKFDYAKFNFFLVPLLVFVIRFQPENYALFFPSLDLGEEEEETEAGEETAIVPEGEEERLPAALRRVPSPEGKSRTPARG